MLQFRCMDQQTKTPTGAPAQAPFMDVVAPPVHAEPAAAPQDRQQPAKATEAPKPPKQHKPGVTMAIVATVIIVLGLGLLATFAYIKQNS